MTSLAGCIIVGPNGESYELVPIATTEAKSSLDKLTGPALGKTIVSLRKAKGINQSELARIVELTQTQLSRIENGLVENPHRSLRTRLALALA